MICHGKLTIGPAPQAVTETAMPLTDVTALLLLWYIQEEVEEEVAPIEEQKLPRGMLEMGDVKKYLQDLSCLEAALLADYPHGVPVRGWG